MKKTLLLAAVATLAASYHASAQTTLVISEVYGGGGNTGTVYKNDFIELYNPTAASIDVSALSVFYASSTGTFTAANSTALTGSIAPGAFYLIQEAAGTGGTTNLPTANVIGTVNLSGTTGKVALALTVNLPSSTAGTTTTNANIIDFLGYGAANQFETTAAAATTNPVSSGRMTPAVDLNNNSLDFSNETPSPGVAFIAVPEPATYAYVIGGLGALALGIRRRSA